MCSVRPVNAPLTMAILAAQPGEGAVAFRGAPAARAAGDEDPLVRESHIVVGGPLNCAPPVGAVALRSPAWSLVTERSGPPTPRLRLRRAGFAAAVAFPAMMVHVRPPSVFTVTCRLVSGQTEL